MSFNSLFNSLRFNADIPLRSGRRTVLKQPLNQRNIIAIGLIDLRGVPLS